MFYILMKFGAVADLNEIIKMQKKNQTKKLQLYTKL